MKNPYEVLLKKSHDLNEVTKQVDALRLIAPLLDDEKAVLPVAPEVQAENVQRRGDYRGFAALPSLQLSSDIKTARYDLVPDSVTMAMLLPPRSEYVNIHNNCFHLHEIEGE